MVLMSQYALGEVPFKNVFLHGTVRDAKGPKNPTLHFPGYESLRGRSAMIANKDISLNRICFPFLS